MALATMAPERSLASLLLCAASLSVYGASDWAQQSSAYRAVRRLSMTSSLRRAIVDKHNDLRAAVTAPCTAADMETMTWDSSLEAAAKAFADKCTWQHDPFNKQFTWGESLAISTLKYYDEAKLVGFVQSWYDEIVDVDWSVGGTSASSKIYADPQERCRNFDSKTGNCMIGQYTQVVAAKTSKVGCGISACSNITHLGEGGLFFVCKYTPAGNYLASGRATGLQPPFIPGAACAACPGNCSQKLCLPGSPNRCTDDASCQVPDALGEDFCGDDRGGSSWNTTTSRQTAHPLSQTTTTTNTDTTSTSTSTSTSTTTQTAASWACNGLDAALVGSHAAGTFCSKSMNEGEDCSAFCSGGVLPLGAFQCSWGRMVDASYCMDPSIEVRTSFRLKVATSFSLQLDAKPSIEALRRSVAVSLGVWEYLVHKVSWRPAATRRLGEPRRTSSNTFSVDLELIVPKNETAPSLIFNTEQLFLTATSRYDAFRRTLQREFGLTVTNIEEVVPPRGFQSLVVSDHVGNIIKIPGQNGTDSTKMVLVQEDFDIGALVAGIVGGLLAMLVLTLGLWYMCKRHKFEA